MLGTSWGESRRACEKIEKRKNCQFYASTCFESLSDCRIMNQNHKIDIIQILPHITFQSKLVCRVMRNRFIGGWVSKWEGETRNDVLEWDEFVGKYFCHFDIDRRLFVRLKATFIENSVFIHPQCLFRFPGTQYEINASVGDNLLHGMQL